MQPANKGIFSSPLEADDNWQTNTPAGSHTQPWHIQSRVGACALDRIPRCTHAHEGVWYISFNRQGIVSLPLEGDHWNIYQRHELHSSSMWTTTKSLTSVGGAVTKTLIVTENHYGPLSAIFLCHVPFSCIGAASRLAWSSANASVLIPMQSSLHTPRLIISHYIVFCNYSYSYKEAILSTETNSPMPPKTHEMTSFVILTGLVSL